MAPLSGAFFAACDDESPAPSKPASDAATLDVKTPEAAVADGDAPDTATVEAGSDANVADVGADAAGDAAAVADVGADAPALTNNSTWLASGGALPSAACAAWTLVDTAAAKDPILSVDGGVMTLGTDSDTENMYYTQGAAVVTTPATLIFEARMKLVSGTSSAAVRGPANVTIRYGATTLYQVALHVVSGEIFINSAESVKGASASVATTDAPHTYRIEVNTTTHAFTVFRDDVSTLTGTAFVDNGAGVQRGISFGEASLFATGVSEWTSVTHNAHALAPCP